MLSRDSFLLFFLGDLVSFGGYERYEFDAAVDEEVARVFAESRRGGSGSGGSQDFGDDLLDGCCFGRVSLVEVERVAAIGCTFWEAEVVDTWDAVRI